MIRCAVVVTRKNLLHGLSRRRFILPYHFDIDDGIHRGGEQQNAYDAASIGQFVTAFQQDGGAKGLRGPHQSRGWPKVQPSPPLNQNLGARHASFDHGKPLAFILGSRKCDTGVDATGIKNCNQEIRS
jgi:hypothetical protein